jgi:tRNA (cytidine56-2'-O)-methyltransferase
MYLAEADAGVVKTITAVVRRWGGAFFCEDKVAWRRCIQEWKWGGGTVVHLTMYGLDISDVISDLRSKDSILVIVGAEKVPGEIFGLADYNVAVTTQPHSEISSLAIFLDHLFSGTELARRYPDAKIRIIPSKAGKKTEE